MDSPELKGSREPNLPRLKFTGKSEADTRHPERNEDCIVYNAQDGIAMVLDGVGGHVSGDRASRVAGNALVAHLKTIPSNSAMLAEREINRALVETSSRVLTEVPGAATTVVVAKFLEGGGARHVVIGSVGDSRAYILRGGGLKTNY